MSSIRQGRKHKERGREGGREGERAGGREGGEGREREGQPQPHVVRNILSMTRYDFSSMILSSDCRL